MKVSRNALCPCGSGKKYKHCHLGKVLPGEEGSTELQIKASSEQRKMAIILGILSVCVGIAAGIWREPFDGIVVAVAAGMLALVYLSFRRPPPPKADAGDPAALNFGRRDR